MKEKEKTCRGAGKGPLNLGRAALGLCGESGVPGEKLWVWGEVNEILL
jgi:hypothetical protein